MSWGRRNGQRVVYSVTDVDWREIKHVPVFKNFLNEIKTEEQIIRYNITYIIVFKVISNIVSLNSVKRNDLN